ncbi:GNAT family N-acetyltransferase [Orbus sasakiae]
MIQNNILRASSNDHPDILSIWYRSVKATHLFLTELDIQTLYHGLKTQWLSSVELWVIEHHQRIVGFIGFDEHKIEMLFVDEPYQGQGFGRQLIDFAKTRYDPLFLDVNEQNPAGFAFYQKQGFTLIGRSATDAQGNPFPLMHMQYIQ